MKRYIKSSSKRPYLYIFKHGIGPGTLPKDVQVVRTKDLPRGYTAVWTDRFLTTSEMDEFDIPYETEINRYLDRIGYCQKNGDVVPCDEVDAWEGYPLNACDRVIASDICYRDRDNDDSVVALDAGMSDEDVEKMLAEHPSYYRSTLDKFEACNDIMASSKLKFGWSEVEFSIKDKPLHWCEYGLSDYEAQITEIHPYDDADYYWAKIRGNIAEFIQGRKVKSSMKLPVYNDDDYEDEAEYLDTITDIVCRELRKLNKNISPRMMHN